MGAESDEGMTVLGGCLAARGRKWLGVGNLLGAALRKSRKIAWRGQFTVGCLAAKAAIWLDPSCLLGAALEQTELARLADGIRARATVEPGKDVAHVHVHGARAQEEVTRDIFVRFAQRDEPQDLQLTQG